MSQNSLTPSDPPPPYESIIDPVTCIPGTVVEPTLEIETTSSTISPNDTTSTVLIKVKPTPGVRRTPVHICCVVDVSGSMSSEAKFRDDSGSLESDGLSILDLVKHSIKTILSTMTSGDMLSVVTFSDAASLKLKPTFMDPAGKVMAGQLVNALHTENSTNIWAGLEMGWNTVLAEREEHFGQISSVFLFTDGMPNVTPPRGHMPMIRSYKERHGLPCSVNTFGFGYELDSLLLDEIAREADGAFVFIPDCSFVGTAFINATANLYTTIAEDVEIEVTSPNQTLNTTIHVGQVRFDQSRDFIITCPTDVDLTLALTFELVADHQEVTKQIAVSNTSSDEEVQKHVFRTQFVDAVQKCVQARPSDGDLSTHLAVIKSSVGEPIRNDPFLKALLEDINGQVTEALDPKYYHRWGRHYLLSLAHAHRAQLCNNFKDPGVQGYGGPLFGALRDNFDEVFNNLPPPKPTLHAGNRAVRGLQTNMRLYNNCRGVCFHGECSVQLATGKIVQVKDIRKGDEVQTLEGFGIVRCVVQTLVQDGVALMVQIGELKVTPYHPILDSATNTWRFPFDVTGEAHWMPCTAVYSFLLEESGRSSSVVVDGVACVTLAHGVVGDLREHPYFGTSAVIEDLKNDVEGWEEGFIICKGVKRNSKTGLVCGMKLCCRCGIQNVELPKSVKNQIQIECN